MVHDIVDQFYQLNTNGLTTRDWSNAFIFCNTGISGMQNMSRFSAIKTRKITPTHILLYGGVTFRSTS